MISSSHADSGKFVHINPKPRRSYTMLVVSRGPKVGEGKTKILYEEGEGQRGWIDIEQKDDITARDGEKHDVIPGKGAFSNQTAVNIFQFLKFDPTINVAFQGQTSPTSLVAPHCAMLPFEVVVRRRAFGSYCERHPHVPEWTVFPRLVTEFFLKTRGKRWEGMDLPKDDPLIHFSNDGVMNLYQPDKPVGTAWGTGEINIPEGVTQEILSEIRQIAPHVFLILEKAFSLADGLELIDFKVEFGIGPNGRLYLADVITPDEVRLMKNGHHESKEAYRRGGQLDMVLKIYERVAQATARFPHVPPKHTLIIWRGSERDDIAPFVEGLTAANIPDVANVPIVCSMHKEPVRGYRVLAETIQEYPDSVVIAFIGRSNGAGPALSALTHVPVITVPSGWEKFPEDVWSSLRTPSDVPVTTCLTPGNALLAAFNIFAIRNPFVYAHVRSQLEQRLTNIIEIN
ncbi:MAG: phosphoribosylaminoimidazolesuccinocarboxamide synthase [bacterium]|nr:phosphoribosylaminoimidazolesuccinocarboxamide synthase [bacterium]